jgi:diguanylate cyclase (GGDEF)-like protein
VPPILTSLGELLDGLGVALCVYDADDATLGWNRSFLDLFPEHVGAVHVGEPYAENLRRFYAGRLAGAERELLERYVAEGVSRHRRQLRPFAFEHRGRRVLVSSLPIAGLGRIRVWRDLGEAAAPGAPTPAPAGQGADLPADASSLLDAVPEGLAITDAHARVLWVNEPFVRLYGLADRRAPLGARLADVLRDVSSDGPAPGLVEERLAFAGAPFDVMLPGERWVQVTLRQRADGSSLSAHVDVTSLRREQRRAEDAERRVRETAAQLLEKSSLLEAALERMEQGVMMINTQRTVEVCNRRAMELLELPRELIDTRPSIQAVLDFQIARGDFADADADTMRVVRAGGMVDVPNRYERRRADGLVIEVQSVPTAGGGVLRTYTDVTERKRREQRILDMARHDGLTRLLNRDAFLEALARACADADRGDAPPSLALLYLDLDGFKPINDAHGHSTGDAVLAEVGARLRAAVRTDDAVARLGGDEFAVLQAGGEQPVHALRLASRLVESIAAPIVVDGRALRVAASVGIALRVGDEPPRAILRRADAAMYTAKGSGSGSVRLDAG